MWWGPVACLLLLVPVAQRKRNVCMLGWFKFASVALLQCDGTEQVASSIMRLLCKRPSWLPGKRCRSLAHFYGTLVMPLFSMQCNNVFWIQGNFLLEDRRVRPMLLPNRFAALGRRLSYPATKGCVLPNSSIGKNISRKSGPPGRRKIITFRVDSCKMQRAGVSSIGLLYQPACWLVSCAASIATTNLTLWSICATNTCLRQRMPPRTSWVAVRKSTESVWFFMKNSLDRFLCPVSKSDEGLDAMLFIRPIHEKLMKRGSAS